MNNILHVKKQFQKKFPGVTVGIGANQTLQVRVKTEEAAKKIPTEFLGVKVIVLVVGKIIAI